MLDASNAAGLCSSCTSNNVVVLFTKYHADGREKGSEIPPTASLSTPFWKLEAGPVITHTHVSN